MELKAILFIALIAAGELALVFGVFGCGGAAFTLIPPDPNEAEANPLDSPIWVDSDSSPEASPNPEAGPPDAFRLPRPDAGHPIDATSEAAIIEASPAEAQAEASPPEAMPICTPIAPYAYACGTNLATTTSPAEFCLAINAGTTVQGQAYPTPSACRCKETYTCACLLVAIPDPCQGRSFQACGLGNGPALRVDCR